MSLVPRSLLAALVMSASASAAFIAGCGGGDGSSSGATPDGGPFPFLDGAIPDSDAGACPPAPTTVLEAKARSLALSGDEIVFVDHAAGPEFIPGGDPDNRTRAIRKVKIDGTGDTVLYTPASLHKIDDLRVVGGTIYFLESERLPNTTEPTRIYSMPLAGGTPQLIVFHNDPMIAGDNDRLEIIAAVDANNLYVVRALQLDAVVYRVAIAGGAEAAIFRGPIGSLPQLVGGDLYFRSGLFPGPASGIAGVAKIAASATEGTPVAVGTAALKGDLIAGDFGLIGAGSTETGTERQISRWALDGTGHTSIFTSTDTSNMQIGPAVDGFVYVVPDGSPTSKRDTLWKVPLAGGPVSVIACNRAEIPRHGDFESGSNQARVATLDMLYTATELIWVENTKESGQPEKSTIFRAPR